MFYIKKPITLLKPRIFIRKRIQQIIRKYLYRFTNCYVGNSMLHLSIKDSDDKLHAILEYSVLQIPYPKLLTTDTPK